MKETFNDLITYFKNPVLETDNNTNAKYRFNKVLHLLVISLITAIILIIPLSVFEELGWLTTENHAVEEMIKKLPIPMVFLFAVVLAPVFEELFFRAPITLFKGKNSFRIAFYVFAIVFGLIHISNYDLDNNSLLFAPVLIIPQIVLGGYLGYIRVKFGLQWSMLLHACYNFILLAPSLLIKYFE